MRNLQRAELENTANAESSLHQILVINDGQNRIVFLEDQSYTIGRDPHNEIPLAHDVVSRYHATLRPLPDAGPEGARRYQLIDGRAEGKQSTNGIFVNQRQCTCHALKHGDVISFGQVVQGIYLEIKMDDGNFSDLLAALNNAAPADFGVESYTELLQLIEDYVQGTPYLSIADPTSIMLHGTWPGPES
jgi:hypothetical protein